MARRFIIGEEEVKRLSINMHVDSGALNLCINEVIQEQLQLSTVGKRSAETADGRIIVCLILDLVDMVIV
jgi:hypothetical protein